MNTLVGEKYIWQLPNLDHEHAFSLARDFNVSIPVAQTLVSRGFRTKEQVDAFLFSVYERDVAHPSHMKDAQKAVDRIIKAIDNKERILIFGDYDVDGMTATSLMMLCLMPLGARVNFFLPHRVKDGYGLSTRVVRRAAQSKYSLIVTVDNGITAYEPVVQARALGIDVIITDHHRPHDKIPPAYAVVNPAQNECPYPFKKLAGVGVIFKVISLLYERKKLTLPSKAYELLLLGTIADVVPLVGENRFWVRHGLGMISKHESFSFQVLKKNSAITRPRINATDIGFFITPQINALGRLEDPRQGISFLIGANTKEVERVGAVLFELNQARKEIERSIFGQVNAEISAGRIDLAKENIILAASNSWPPGVIGLVASRLVSAYGRPTFLFHLDKGNLAKGSCRSIKSFDIFEALSQVHDLLESFGGHPQAAGLSLKVDRLPEFKERLEQIISVRLTSDDLSQKLELDAEITMNDINQKLMADVTHLEPFGHENAQPIFYLKKVSLLESPTLLKDEHVKCRVFADGIIKPVIFFNRPELWKKLSQQDTQPFDLAVHVAENHWNGQVNIELIGCDVAGLKEI